MSPRPDGRRHTPADLYHERTNFEFVGRAWRWALLSGVVVLVGVVSFAVKGLNLGIDFTGGTSWQFNAGHGVTLSPGRLRDVMRPFGIADAKIVILDAGRGAKVQTKNVKPSEEAQITDALAREAHVSASRDISVSDVGPTWGGVVTDKAVRSLIVFFALIALYLSLRFEWKMAVSAIVAVIHDIIVTVGVYAFTGFEVTPATVIAFLTILGFSLYDTVVVFDKIKENQPSLGTARDVTYSGMANRSMNEVLMRSLNTSFLALLPVGSILVVGSWLFGALSLRDFGVALFVGLLTGAYSSIFVATPILAWWKEREPRHRGMRERALVQSARASVARASGDGEEVASARERERVGATSRPSGAPGAPVITPRPRQQRRGKRR